MFKKKTIIGIPKKYENLDENSNGYHVYGQNILYQYPQKVLNDEKYLTKIKKGKPIIAYTSSTAQIGIINESFYRTGDNGAFQGLFPKFKDFNYNQILFILVAIKRKFIGLGYNTSMAHIINLKIKLPTKEGRIYFEFMDNFVAALEAQRVAALEAYLTITGLKDYELTVEEEKALDCFEELDWKDFQFGSIFNNIKQGKRLKNADQIKGDISFVMSGVTNTGVTNYISNPIIMFPSNSVTIDIFGNAFFRNFEFSAGDDTGVYWNDEEVYSENTLLFITSSINKSLSGKYSYGHKLRSSRSKELLMKLPTKHNALNQNYMETFITAIKKLVIKDVVNWTDKKLELTKDIVKVDMR